MLGRASEISLSLHRPVILASWRWELHAEELALSNVDVADEPDDALAAIIDLDSLTDLVFRHFG